MNYKVVNGTSYHEETNDKVVSVLENSRINRKRIRIFYGDVATGKDWNEENDTMGTVGRSMGTVKIPLLIHNSRSIGGGGILDHCIVKITQGKTVLYQHPNYNMKSMTIVTTPTKEYTHHVDFDNVRHASFKSETKMNRYVDFITGKSNRK